MQPRVAPQGLPKSPSCSVARPKSSEVEQRRGRLPWALDSPGARGPCCATGPQTRPPGARWGLASRRRRDGLQQEAVLPLPVLQSLLPGPAPLRLLEAQVRDLPGGGKSLHCAPAKKLTDCSQGIFGEGSQETATLALRASRGGSCEVLEWAVCSSPLPETLALTTFKWPACSWVKAEKSRVFWTLPPQTQLAHSLTLQS